VRYLKWLGIGVIVLAVWSITLNWEQIVDAFKEEWVSLLCVIVGLLLFYLVLRWFGRPLLIIKFRLINKVVSWHKLPLPLGVLNLVAFRMTLRKKNLTDIPLAEMPDAVWSHDTVTRRTADGSFNDANDPNMGRAGMRFGRNVPMDKVVRQANIRLMEPNPRLISQRLMVRDTFKPATILNLLAAAWIQFMVHGWLNHLRDPKKEHDIPLDDDDPFPDRPMTIERTLVDSPESPSAPATFRNFESHWWDGSQIYGSSKEIQDSLRTFQDGKLITVRNDEFSELRLPGAEGKSKGLDRTGFFDNYWMGLSLLHTLFTLEHNAICDRLAADYPQWDDESLFQTARLINAALMAKIHTVEWTPAILAHPTMQVSMSANWWGLFGERFKRMLGRVSDSEELSGVIGSPVDHHGAGYAMTEEFTSVYRLHPLIPDEFHFVKLDDPDADATVMSFTHIQGAHTRDSMQDKSMADMLYSFGIAHPGAVTLRNYPSTMRTYERMDSKKLDLAAVDILRDRERGVPRYNEFRRACHMPPVKRFRDLTASAELADEIAQVYGNDIESVDLMVGLFAETPPDGFGFSDTAFRIFILMASRRLKSDRFFCEDYRAEVYTQAGLDWIDDNDMRAVIRRHHPVLGAVLKDVNNAFAPWGPITESRVNVSSTTGAD
jgi:hypothetical protein